MKELYWPKLYPEFINTIEGLVVKDQKCKIGLMLINVCAEEFGKVNKYMVESGTRALQGNVTSQLPVTINWIGSLMAKTTVRII